MSLFNKLNKKVKKTLNRAGGQAYVQSPKMALASMLLTSFAQDQFYRSAKNTYGELTPLIPKAGAEFAAKAAIYARTEFGMRSITHVLAAEIAAHASGQPWAKHFYNQVVYRPDDMLEILAYYYATKGKSLPLAMKKGFAKAFDKFDGYQLAKYRGENKGVKLIDTVNLVHPKPTDKNAVALKELVAGTLRSTGTWEAKLTQAGQRAENADDKAQKKAAAWTDLLQSRKLGYFALLRNLRNIATQAPQMIDLATEMLTDRKAIKRSMVMPFRFLAAQDVVKELDPGPRYKLTVALNKAIEISLDNVPRFDGSTLVVLDDSGSMTWSQVKGMNRRPIDIGALFAAMLFKSNEADLMCFSDDARYVHFNVGDTAQSIASKLVGQAKSGGTNFHAIFQKAKRAYDRIIILSDMQGWIGHYSPEKAYKAYKVSKQADPYIYSFDLQGYGSLQFPQNKVFALAGFSDKVFDLMNLLESDPKALVTAIESIEF